ncbi:MAG: xanthine dehydrogenase family protein molybdopterin-binding subunit [bacterium]|nr:xanthine dehydrogenase family protein molybdopterin-binding subunit [bacterium]
MELEFTTRTTFDKVGTRPPRPDGTDKVTGRALYGADLAGADMLVGKVLRSPHAHARILAIDTSRAEALTGVKAVVTRDDFPHIGPEGTVKGEVEESVWDVARNVMARDKALFDGHAVAAVAATSTAVARQALKLIDITWQVLPHVTDVDEAMRSDAPLVHEDMITAGMDPVPEEPSNIAEYRKVEMGDIEAGFAAADVIAEQSFRTEAAHQGYIEPHACVASASEDGLAELWCCTQGHFSVRDMCANILGMDLASLRVTSSEIGGGFGGKTTVFLEPVALLLSRKSGRPVKMTMSRDEVFRASGPTSSTSITARIGATRDGRITACDATLRYQGGAFPGSPVGIGAVCGMAPYDCPNVVLHCYDVVVNRPKAAAYRAPGAPMAAFAIESLLDDIARKLDIDPVELRLKNAVKEGSSSVYGPTFGPIGFEECLETARDHPSLEAVPGPNQARGIAAGFWPNFGGQTSVTVNVNTDGTVLVSLGTPDIGGSRASMCLMAAEELQIPYERVKAIIADTSALGHNDTTGGSRVTHSAGLATIEASRKVIDIMKRRAAATWDIDVDAVVWDQGCVRPSGANAGDHEPLTFDAIAAMASATGGPIAGHAEINAEGAGASFAVHVCDLEVDPETGRVTILRYLAVQDAGKAIHPDYVEGQYQGGVTQGIGWALNEEYIYGSDGVLQNPGFLDYRIPVASDLPMIDTVIVEVPNPGHPYGVRGVGETPIVPPLAAVANAVSRAIGRRMTETPMSPPRILAAIDGTS